LQKENEKRFGISKQNAVLKKTRIIFFLLSLYIIAAFAWWTYAHILENKEIYKHEKENLELLCFKASVDMEGASQDQFFRDTTEAKKYFYHNFPKLEIIFDLEKENPLDYYLIRPQKESYDLIKNNLDRKIWMYLLEGVVMVLLLFWGIIWIYQSLQNRLNLKRQQSNFLLSITHELKTPLASIKLYIETLRKRKLTEEQTDTILKNSLTDVERLHDLVENLLIAARLDNHKYEPYFELTNFSVLVSETIDKFIAPRTSNHQIVKNIEPDVFLSVDENAIVMILNNLLSNAAKYSPENTVIEISLHQDHSITKLSVSNEGPNIDDEDKKNLFSRFYRAGNENTRKNKGTGLGLFIVKNLLTLHKADIFVKDKNPQGAIFEIEFKKNEKNTTS